MQEVDVLRLLHLLESEYPQSFSKLDERQRSLKKELWMKEFATDDSKVVYAAVRLLMRDGREFAPTSGQIREKIQSLMEKETLDPQQAWVLVSRACSNGLYGYKREFDKLPPEIQMVVGRPEQLKEWASMDAETVQSVVASNFMKNYRLSVTKEKELARIPQGVKDLIANVASTTKLVGEYNEKDY